MTFIWSYVLFYWRRYTLTYKDIAQRDTALISGVDIEHAILFLLLTFHLKTNSLTLGYIHLMLVLCLCSVIQLTVYSFIHSWWTPTVRKGIKHVAADRYQVAKRAVALVVAKTCGMEGILQRPWRRTFNWSLLARHLLAQKGNAGPVPGCP